jgi:hypothetical protein
MKKKVTDIDKDLPIIPVLLGEINLVFRKGLPTKKSMEEIFMAFFGERLFYKIRISRMYGKIFGVSNEVCGTIHWQDERIQEKMDGFIEYLSELGLKCGRYYPYVSPRVGSIEIISKNAPKTVTKPPVEKIVIPPALEIEPSGISAEESKELIKKNVKYSVKHPDKRGGQSCGMPAMPVILTSEELELEITVGFHRSQMKNRELAQTLFELALDELVR